MFTGKDVTRKILNKLEDKDLVNFCQVNKQAEKICNDQVFWMNRVFQRYNYVGVDVLRKYKGRRTWSQYYINDLRKIQFDANKYLIDGSHNGRLDQVIIALKNGADKYFSGVATAAQENKQEIVMYLLSEIEKSEPSILLGHRVNYEENYEDILNNGMRWAVTNDHIDLADKMLKMGGDPNGALAAAAGTGKQELVDHYVELGGTDFSRALDNATFYPELEQYILYLMKDEFPSLHIFDFMKDEKHGFDFNGGG